MPLDLRKLTHFRAVAENRSISRAARRLHLTPQALSMSIRALEREVGTALFERSHRGLTLTPAGEVLHAEAASVLAVARSALERTRHTGRDSVTPLRIGHTPAVTGDEVIELLHLARARSGDDRLSGHAVQLYPFQIPEQLREGSIDIALSRAMRPGPGFATGTVHRHRLRIAVHATHRLARRDTLQLADLAAECLMVWAPAGHSGYTDLLLGVCRAAGVEPRCRVNPDQGTPPVTAALNRDCVVMVTAPAGPALGGAVRVIDLEPPYTVPVEALWLEAAANPVRTTFISAFTTGLGREPTTGAGGQAAQRRPGAESGPSERGRGVAPGVEVTDDALPRLRDGDDSPDQRGELGDGARR